MDSGAQSGEQEIDWDNVKIPKYAAVDVRYSVNKKKVTDLLNSVWNGGGNSDLSELGVKIWREPFRCCEVTEFLFDDDFVEDLGKNFEEIELNEKRTDLYKFKQSEDLSSIDDPEAETLVKCLKGQCRQWVEEVTGFELTDKVHATFSSYSQSDYLLCHDDRCEDRKIAFILYCNKIWEESDGGALELYDTDERGQPKNVVKTILPAYNKFVFFEVSDKSFHRVAEVLSRQRDRISVNGWFHSGNIPPPSPVSCNLLDSMAMSYHLPQDLPEKEFSSIIQHRYLREEVQVDIKKHFEEESEVMLFDFLGANFMNAVTNDLHSAVEWKKVGPANHRLLSRSYRVFQDEENLYGRLAQLINALKSKPMFELLSKLTGLDFKIQQKEEMPRCSYEVQRWERGDYTVISDTDKLPTDYALDVILFISDEVVLGEQSGGSVVYLDSEDGSELLSIPPADNCLALVYRDKKTHRFTQYLSLLNNQMHYYAIFATYIE
ncbi:prolyl 3-hydroxylase OGFOD1 isoform X2 [Anabrus simplex]|uniref:prolyl 3-hydroxylase OGFOD1 isoform X2 n=1 Tax=Anabrus simplex TaxID=316456 RepID=UPI0035A31C98